MIGEAHHFIIQSIERCWVLEWFLLPLKNSQKITCLLSELYPTVLHEWLMLLFLIQKQIISMILSPHSAFAESLTMLHTCMSFHHYFRPLNLVHSGWSEVRSCIYMMYLKRPIFQWFVSYFFLFFSSLLECIPWMACHQNLTHSVIVDA